MVIIMIDAKEYGKALFLLTEEEGTTAAVAEELGAVREILRQLAKMRAGKITDDEFKMAVKTLAHQSRTLSDEPTALERFYFTRALFGVNETPEEFLASLSTLTIRDVVRVAKKVTTDTVYFLRSMPSEGMEEEVEEDA